MGDYYNSDDLGRFGEVGKYKPELFRKFMDWYQASLEDGALTKREKALIGLGVAHVIQCPYCIDAFTRECIAEGMDMDHIRGDPHRVGRARWRRPHPRTAGAECGGEDFAVRHVIASRASRGVAIFIFEIASSLRFSQ
jgi:alkylhydroperoxidase/carboxymuconolactone decarboxylase family protein